uniref:Uncharacterized protein n=1 Tax=Arundo donax TaxID=35708 RepID=A0A0A9GWD3_ARUDO
MIFIFIKLNILKVISSQSVKSLTTTLFKMKYLQTKGSVCARACVCVKGLLVGKINFSN